MRTLHERVEQTGRGENPTVICRMLSGWAVLGNSQFLRGYSLLPDPGVPDLNALGTPGRTRFLLDMTLAGDALLEVTGAARITYSVFGNTDAALHPPSHRDIASNPKRCGAVHRPFTTVTTPRSSTSSAALCS